MTHASVLSKGLIKIFVLLSCTLFLPVLHIKVGFGFTLRARVLENSLTFAIGLEVFDKNHL